MRARVHLMAGRWWGFLMATGSEIVSTPLDKNTNRIPRHRAGRENQGAPPGQQGIWSSPEVVDVPVFGRLPFRFLRWCRSALQAPRSATLHVCSGTLERRQSGLWEGRL